MHHRLSQCALRVQRLQPHQHRPQAGDRQRIGEVVHPLDGKDLLLQDGLADRRLTSTHHTAKRLNYGLRCKVAVHQDGKTRLHQAGPVGNLLDQRHQQTVIRHGMLCRAQQYSLLLLKPHRPTKVVLLLDTKVRLRQVGLALRIQDLARPPPCLFKVQQVVHSLLRNDYRRQAGTALRLEDLAPHHPWGLELHQLVYRLDCKDLHRQGG